MDNVPGERLSGSILLTGGTGLLGQALVAQLDRLGCEVLLGVRGQQQRSSDPGPVRDRRLPWDPEAAIPFRDRADLEGLRAAIHLSGANLAARRWTPEYKREVVTSRTHSTSALARTLAGLKNPPAVLLTASATGIYGDRGDEVLTEASAPGSGLLSETCQAWEAAAAPAVDAGIRVVHLRFGVVLSTAGGALKTVLPLFRSGLGGRLGSGKQWMSWIAIEDAVSASLHLAGLDAPCDLAGAVNCVSPNPVTNAEYTRALGKALHRPALIAAPKFALRIAMGEMADAAVLASCRAVPERLLASGFHFAYPEIEQALAHLLKH